MILRPYQKAAVDAVYKYFEGFSGNPLVVMPTATGKSLFIAGLIKKIVTEYPGTRILNATHVKELVAQNAEKFRILCPEIRAGVFSAGLKQKNTKAPVLFCGIQSVFRHAFKIQQCDILIVDECFTGETLIETVNGPKRIDLVRPGEKVFNAFGWGTVKAIFVKETHDIYEVLFSDGTKFECTGKHPVFTEKGWVAAKRLEKGQGVFSREALQLLQGYFPPMDKKGRNRQGHRHLQRKSMECSKMLLCILCEEIEKSDERSIFTRKNEAVFVKDWSQTHEAWGQWKINRNSRPDFEDFERGLEGGACNSNQNKARPRISHLLQAGFSKSFIKNWHRIGWWITYGKKKSTRSKERCPFKTVRVESVSRKQQASPTLVYNMHVSGHPSYFANGKLVHNCHAIPKKGEGMWRSFIKDLKIINPHLKVVGCTATDFRMDSGSLTYGEDRLFTDIAYNYPILEAMEDGYLCPVIPVPAKTSFDVSGVQKRGGEFVPGQLEKVYNVDEKTEAAIQEILEKGQDRKSWLIFAAGNAHAEAVGACLRAHGIDCRVLTQDTSDEDRDQMILDLKSGALKCVVNNMILTTGFDAPNLDLIAVLRSIGSPGLWVQILGRGFRVIYAAGYDLSTALGRIAAIANGPKPNCLVLDFGGNAERHGPIDKIKAKNKDGTGTGDPVVKKCPKCEATCFAAVRECPDCGYAFPEPELKIETKASTAPLLSNQVELEWMDVDAVSYVKHSKEGKPDSLRVDYYKGVQRISEWVALWHGGGATRAAERWWRRRALYDVAVHGFPENIDHAIAAAEGGMLRTPKSVGFIKEGKFNSIKNYNFNVD